MSPAGTSGGLRARRIRHFRRRLARRITAYARLVPALNGARHVLPDYLIIGAMKCGTTSLFDYLQQHPGIARPRLKEVQYLSNPRLFRLGENWYRAHFPTRRHMLELEAELGYRPLTGEATPAMISDFYATNAGTLLPDARIIIVLRDPVDRAYSHYHHTRRTYTGEPLPFWEALQAEQERIGDDLRAMRDAPHRVSGSYRRYSYTMRGKYIDQIENWMRFFPVEQMRIFNYERFAADPGETCNRVCEFLGLPRHEFSHFSRLNEGHYAEPMDARSREYLTDIFRPYNRRLFDFLGEDWGWPT